MKLALIALLCMMLVQCTNKPTPTPVYTKSAINLVIGLDDLPPGWEVSWLPEYHHNEGSFDGAFTHFRQISSTSTAGAYQQIGLYKSDEEAARYLEDTTDWFPEKFTNSNTIPDGWSSMKLSADETRINCGPVNDWSFAARYSNVLVRFAVASQPPLMTIEQFLDIVKKIDAKMGREKTK